MLPNARARGDFRRSNTLTETTTRDSAPDRETADDVQRARRAAPPSTQHGHGTADDETQRRRHDLHQRFPDHGVSSRAMNDRRSFRTRRRRLDPSKSPRVPRAVVTPSGRPRDFRFFTSIRRHTRTRHVSRVDSAHRDDARARRRARDDDDAAIRARDDDARRVIVGVIIITGPNLESNPRRRLGERGRGDASSRRVARCRRGLARVVVERGSIGVDDDARGRRARAGRERDRRRATWSSI